MGRSPHIALHFLKIPGPEATSYHDVNAASLLSRGLTYFTVEDRTTVEICHVRVPGGTVSRILLTDSVQVRTEISKTTQNRHNFHIFQS